MNGFAIGASAAALAGLGIGTVATAMTPSSDEVGPNHSGLVRKDIQFYAGLAIPAAMGSAFLGMTTDTPALFLGASALAGVAAGGFLGSAIAGIAHSRATA